LAIVLSVLLSFGHYVVCPSVFWPLCCLSFCLLAIMLSVLLSFGHYVVCSSVFWPLCCLSFCLLAIMLSVLLKSMDSNYPFVSSNSSKHAFFSNPCDKQQQSSVYEIAIVPLPFHHLFNSLYVLI
jgi:ABC-type transport system involved in multi-copper enzyme maturation permease subunit